MSDRPEALSPDELRDLAEKATPGPWWVEVGGDLGERFYALNPGARWRGFTNPLNCGEDGAMADYLAAVDPATILGLLAEVERLNAERDREGWESALIVSVPGRMCGQRVFGGSRLTVSAVFAFIRRGFDDAAIQAAYPGLTDEQLAAAHELYEVEGGGEPENELADERDALAAELASVRPLVQAARRWGVAEEAERSNRYTGTSKARTEQKRELWSSVKALRAALDGLTEQRPQRLPFKAGDWVRKVRGHTSGPERWKVERSWDSVHGPSIDVTREDEEAFIANADASEFELAAGLTEQPQPEDER